MPNFQIVATIFPKRALSQSEYLVGAMSNDGMIDMDTSGPIYNPECVCNCPTTENVEYQKGL